MPMKLLATVDDNGHFTVQDITTPEQERAFYLRFLKYLVEEKGLDLEMDEADEEDLYDTGTLEQIRSLVYDHTLIGQRGTCEPCEPEIWGEDVFDQLSSL